MEGGAIFFLFNKNLNSIVKVILIHLLHNKD